MKLIKYILIFFWRIWFYVLTLLATLLFSPFIFITILKDSWYPAFYFFARLWAMLILFGMGFIPKITYEEKIEENKSYVFCPNHTSMIDIMLMLYLSKNIMVFIGKKELGKIPVFGYFYKKTSILVDRNSRSSKSQAFEEARERIEKGYSVCIYPEGKVPEDESIVLDEFKSGAFRLGIIYQIPIVPVTLYDCKEHFSFTFFSGKPGILRAKVHKFIYTNGLTLDDANALKEKTRAIILNELLSDLNNKKS